MTCLLPYWFFLLFDKVWYALLLQFSFFFFFLANWASFKQWSWIFYWANLRFPLLWGYKKIIVFLWWWSVFLIFHVPRSLAFLCLRKHHLLQSLLAGLFKASSLGFILFYFCISDVLEFLHWTCGLPQRHACLWAIVRIGVLCERRQ